MLFLHSGTVQNNFTGDLKSVPFVILNIYDFCLKH